MGHSARSAGAGADFRKERKSDVKQNPLLIHEDLSFAIEAFLLSVFWKCGFAVVGGWEEGRNTSLA